ncbi:MAG: 4Fe-4S binding protein [Candidatus Verstraetearchaeota archaeon]|nr:4Fe-4S binding protein [Candidatus Verstraetearchaeota archaeon]
MSLRAKETLVKNRWRYIAFVAGFFLFVAPFALLTRAVYFLVGNTAEPTLHSVCFRMPIDWIFGGRFYSIFGSSWFMAAFVFTVIISSIFFGAVFCGWLCPVGAVSEALSRAVPIPKRFRIRIRDTTLTVSMRYGFLVGFIIIAFLVGYKLASDQFGSICCRYCSSSVLQNFASALFEDPSAVGYWHSGSIITLLFWLLIGGLMFSGGRGWCLFFCPLGALSGLAHKIGGRLGFYRVEHNKGICTGCNRCQSLCPMWAIKNDHTVERTLCVNCKECIHACDAYKLVRGKSIEDN